MDSDRRDFYCGDFYSIRAERPFITNHRNLSDASVQFVFIADFFYETPWGSEIGYQAQDRPADHDFRIFSRASFLQLGELA